MANMESRSVSPVVAGKVLKGPRACATCAKAKSRCIAGPRGQEKCERYVWLLLFMVQR